MKKKTTKHKQTAVEEGKALAKWFREVRIPEIEAEQAVQGSAVVLTLTSKERRELATLLTEVAPPSSDAKFKRWIDILVPEGL